MADPGFLRRDLRPIILAKFPESCIKKQIGPGQGLRMSDTPHGSASSIFLLEKAEALTSDPPNGKQRTMK